MNEKEATAVMRGFETFLDKFFSSINFPDDPLEEIKEEGLSQEAVADLKENFHIHQNDRIVFINYIWMIYNFPHIKIDKYDVREIIQDTFDSTEVEEIIKYMKITLNDHSFFRVMRDDNDWEFELRFYNFWRKKRLTEITSEDRDLLIEIKGIPIVRGREVAGIPREIEWECLECGTRKIQIIPKGQRPTKFKKPCGTMIGEEGSEKGFRCGSRKYNKIGVKKFQNIFNLQIEALVEETPNKLEPNVFHLELLDNLCAEQFQNQIALGSAFKFTGIIKMRDVSSRDSLPRHIPYMEVMAFRELKEKRFDDQISDMERKQIEDFLKQPDSLDKVSETFGKRVVGFEREKKWFILSKLLQERFNNTDQRKPKNYLTHGLIVGNYGRGKSELVEVFQEICDNPYYVIGSATTGVGLLGVTIRDELTGQFGIQAGVLARASGDTLIVEEFDKTRDKTEFGALNEAMSKYTYTITKGGKQREFKSQTSVVVIANPEKKQFDETLSLIPQINIAGDLLSRFDVISCVLSPKKIEDELKIDDVMLEKADREIYKDDLKNAEFIKKCIKVASKEEPNINIPEVKKYVKSFTKRAFVLSKQTYGADKDFYQNITPRHRQSLVKMIKAVAMWHLHPIPTEEDMQEAFNLMAEFWKEFIQRPKLLNLKEVESGESIEEIEEYVKEEVETQKWEVKVEESKESKKGKREIILEKIKNSDEKIELDGLQRWAKEKIEMTEIEFDELIEKMLREGQIFEPTKGFVRRL